MLHFLLGGGREGKEVGECAEVEVSAMSYIAPHVQVKVEGEERGNTFYTH